MGNVKNYFHDEICEETLMDDNKELVRKAAIICMQRICADDLFVCSNASGNPIERMVHHIEAAINNALKTTTGHDNNTEKRGKR